MYQLNCVFCDIIQFIVFLGTGITIPFWDLVGSTMVTPKQVRITPDEQSKSGAIWNSVVSLSDALCIHIST